MCRSGQCVVNDTCVSPTTVSSTSTLILLREQLRSQEQQIANYSLQNRELEQKVFDGRLREAQLEQNLSLAREQKPAPEPPSQTPAQEVSAAPSNAGVLDVNSSARAKCSQFSRGPNREFVAWSEAGQLDCNPAKLTAQQKQAATECAEATRCYPGAIRIGTYETRVAPGTHSFILFSNFPCDLFHVSLHGITIANALVTSLGNNQHRVSYCVHLPGNYKLHIRLLSVNGWAGFDRALWGSPFSIQVTDPQELVIPTSLAPVRASELPVCVNAYDASYGEWVRVDALSVAERHAWHSTVLWATR